jgi:hypothetical protein
MKRPHKKTRFEPIMDTEPPNLPSIFIHDNSHTSHVQPISFRGQTLPKSIRDMVRTQQRSQYDQDVRYDQSESDDIPLLQDITFDSKVSGFTSWEI